MAFVTAKPEHTDNIRTCAETGPSKRPYFKVPLSEISHLDPLQTVQRTDQHLGHSYLMCCFKAHAPVGHYGPQSYLANPSTSSPLPLSPGTISGKLYIISICLVRTAYPTLLKASLLLAKLL